jgi:hypothetical protein
MASPTRGRCRAAIDKWSHWRGRPTMFVGCAPLECIRSAAYRVSLEAGGWRRTALECTSLPLWATARP